MMKNINVLNKSFLLSALATIVACSSGQKLAGNSPSVDTADRIPASGGPVDGAGPRGSVSEYDAGPPANSKWSDLFADTPNYRAFGMKLLQSKSEKFRWGFGPMFYRGRLTPGDVKVFIVGQEGAQDENVSSRSFTGSTGTKMQNFLNHFGINRSYLFMNTFLYTINGQYTAKDAKIMWLAQSEDSIIVKHRHRLFNYMLETNKDALNLVIGVGTAGKHSVLTWVRSKWKEAGQDPLKKCATISNCDGTILGPKVKIIGVVHPGGAAPRNGGDDQGAIIRKDFSDKANLVANWKKSSPDWLPADPGAKPMFSGGFMYRDAAIPFRDFHFGTNPRNGKDGTSSNRKDPYRAAGGEHQSIQIYSDGGCYNNVVLTPEGRCDRSPSAKTEYLQYKIPQDLTSAVPGLGGRDMPQESPKGALRTVFDRGPGKDMAAILMGVEPGYVWPDFKLLGVTQHLSLGTGQIYRGRLDHAQVLVLADQESNDDLFAGRALMGSGGQRFQSFLHAMGAGSAYGIIRTLPVDTLDLAPEKVKAIAMNADVAKVRNEILSRILEHKETRVIVTVGSIAAEAIKSLPVNIPVVNLDFPDDAGKHATQWNQALNKLKSMNLVLEGSSNATWSYAANRATYIPREDIPNNIRWWMGTAGTRSSRPFNPRLKAQDGNYYKIFAPEWAMRFAVRPLSDEENQSLASYKPLELTGYGGTGGDTEDARGETH